MLSLTYKSHTIHVRCLHRQSKHLLRENEYRAFSVSPVSPHLPTDKERRHDDTHLQSKADEEGDKGAMSRRLEDMMDRSIEEGGQAAQKAVEEAGFSEELKRTLELRIQDNKFMNENPTAFAQLNLPSSAGKGTRDVATAQPWSGTESIEDAALRMLNDAHKPLRGIGPTKIPTPRGPPPSVDMRMKKALQKSQGERLANARDRTSIYALSQDPNMNEKEREQMRKQLKERFTSGARPMPGSVQGLAALANERIEDAIARGLFKNIPRGKGKNIDRDYTASSPFLDTTEYFMNKIIQKQDIVPPWIEKQQELVKAAAVFRGRLRADWKRHAARVIASKGGPLDAQVRRAKAYAAAEAANNPKAPKAESLNEIDGRGKAAEVLITETVASPDELQDSNITVVTEDSPSSTSASGVDGSTFSPSSPEPRLEAFDHTMSNESETAPLSEKPLPQVYPFRDPAWEALERAYHILAITNLNNLARSYNLMAPDLAKKPYFGLERELRSCFADVAPQLPGEIQARARAPTKIKVEVVGHRPGGVLERFGGDKARVYDSQKPNYGFRDFWKDLWGGEKERMI